MTATLVRPAVVEYDVSRDEEASAGTVGASAQAIIESADSLTSEYRFRQQPPPPSAPTAISGLSASSSDTGTGADYPTATAGTFANSVAKAELETRLPDGQHMIRLVPCIDHSVTIQCANRKPVERKLKGDGVIKMGRSVGTPEADSIQPILFKSKVVSRAHAEVFVENGTWYVRDIGSSSGTFLNSWRLSPANKPSPKCELHDGDIMQLGINFRGGTEDVFRCVKMRVELDSACRRVVSEYNVESLKKLREQYSKAHDTTELQNCAICFGSLLPCQPLFIAPCAHGWHYRCIRPLLVRSYPLFRCPNCRNTYDLEEDEEEEEEKDAEAA